jgi:hypothetical protein
MKIDVREVVFKGVDEYKCLKYSTSSEYLKMVIKLPIPQKSEKAVS